MRRSLFLTILERVCVRDPYFIQKRDVCDLVGLFSRQKMMATLQMLSLGVLLMPWMTTIGQVSQPLWSA